jgi:hypothetical protein
VTSNRPFEQAIRDAFGCDSSFVDAVPVVETFDGEVEWEGLVHTYHLEGHAEGATHCYVWAEPTESPGSPHRIYTVLRQSPINSPLKAVQASSVQRYRDRIGQWGGREGP